MNERCHTPGIESFSDKVERAADCPVPQSLRSHVTLKSPAVYIYTSGTTGKAAAAQMAVVMPWFVLPWLVSSQVSPRQPSSIRTASSPFWLFCRHMASRPMMSSISTCPCTTPLDFLSGLLAPLRRVRWCWATDGQGRVFFGFLHSPHHISDCSIKTRRERKHWKWRQLTLHTLGNYRPSRFPYEIKRNSMKESLCSSHKGARSTWTRLPLNSFLSFKRKVG